MMKGRNQSYTAQVLHAGDPSSAYNDGCHQHDALQNQKAVSAYLKSKQIRPFDFAR